MRADGAAQADGVEAELRERGAGGALLHQFQAVQAPARHSKRYTDAVRDFVDTAVYCWSLGATEESIRQLVTEENEDERSVTECAELVAIAWLTMEHAPSVKAENRRLTLSAASRKTAVEEHTADKWRGFVKMVLDGYYSRGIVWQEPSRLAAERELNPLAESESVHFLCERMRIIFWTLHRGCGVPAGF